MTLANSRLSKKTFIGVSLMMAVILFGKNFAALTTEERDAVYYTVQKRPKACSRLPARYLSSIGTAMRGRNQKHNPYFTAPNANPLTKYLCNHANTTETGNVAQRVAAITRCHSTTYFPATISVT